MNSHLLENVIYRLFHKFARLVSWQLLPKLLPKFSYNIFQESLKDARRTYGLLQSTGIRKEFIHPVWEEWVKVIENYFIDNFSVDFLKHPLIQETMFLSGGGVTQRAELQYLNSILTKNKMRHYLRENRLGNPAITSIRYLTSHNSIHHLHHLIRFEQVSGVKLNQTSSIIEFGGGYGNMAKIYKRINPLCTYIIVDLPVFCCIQYSYLRTLLGRDSTYLLSDPKDPVRIGKINLMPIGFVDYLEDIPNGLFVSTWALSEAATEAQTFIQNKRFFNAKSILLAFHQSDDTFKFAGNKFAENIVPVIISLKNKNHHLEKIKFLKHNYYLFAWST